MTKYEVLMGLRDRLDRRLDERITKLPDKDDQYIGFFLAWLTVRRFFDEAIEALPLQSPHLKEPS